MSERLARDGVELVLGGGKQFITDLGKVNAIWDETVNRFRNAQGQFTKVNQSFTQTSQDAVSAGGGIASFAGATAIATKAVDVLVDTVGKLANGLVGLMKNSLQLAGEFQEMEFTSLAIGRAMGLTETEIRTAAKDIEALGIRTDVANKTVAQFARNQMDLAKATDLVRIAQATGIIIGEDSSATMGDLTRAITTGSTIMLRRMGIMLDNVDVEERYARSIGKHREELTAQEQMLARTNAIIEQGANLLDVYDAAMESPTKRLRSLTGRTLPQLQAALGAPFLQAWSTVIKSVSDFATALTKAISEGGALYPVLIQIGAYASLMADGFASAVGMMTDLITGLADDTATGIGDTIFQALQWGAELVAAFAQGIVEATTGVLTQAMQFIGDTLSRWLLGASPPKVAPGIVGWGINLMNQYLQGMTQADFDILKAVQGPLKKVLEGPAFADITKTLAGMLAGGDRAGFVETVGKAAGVFGEAISKLAGLNFELADSVDAVRTAEEALTRAREKVTDAQAEVNTQTREYNRLLREGASADILAAQLKQINAAEATLQTTMDRVDTEEGALKQAKERQTQLEEEKKLQEALVEQLLGVNDALIVQEKEREKAGKAAKGEKELRPLAEMPIPATFDITSRIGAAIDAMKETLKEKFKDIFQPLRDAWDAMVKDVRNLGQVWENFKGIVGQAWDSLKERYPVLQDVETWLKDSPRLLQTVIDYWRPKLTDAISAVTGVLWGNEDSLYNRWQDLWSWLQEDFWPWWKDTLWAGFLEFKDNVLAPLAAGFLGVANEIGKVVEKADKLLAALALVAVSPGLQLLIGHSPSPLELGLRGINQQLAVLSAMRLPALGQMGMQMQNAVAPVQMLSPMNQTSITMNMGGNAFYNNMDQARFDARVERAVSNAVRR